MYEALNRIRVVLVNTSHPGNIGAAARAMKTMGLSRLYLVEPEQYPSAEATARASGADDVLANAKICASLNEALQGCVLVVGTSTRSRRLQWPCVTPGECAQRLLHDSERGDVALLFGRERSGLTNEELDLCHLMVSISANPEYSSLNLASAVQVLSYELRKTLELEEGAAQTGKPAEPDEAPATVEEMEGLFGHLQQMLSDVGVMSAEEPKQSLLRRLRRVFHRAQLTGVEVNIMRGVFSAAQGKKQQRSGK